MKAFAFPLTHQPHVEKELEHAIRRVGLDVALRDHDDDSRLLGITAIDDSEVVQDFNHRGGTLLVMVIEQDGRTITEICTKCGLDRKRAEFYKAPCYPLAGYSDDGFHYPPPSEAHEYSHAVLPPDPVSAFADHKDSLL